MEAEDPWALEDSEDAFKKEQDLIDENLIAYNQMS